MKNRYIELEEAYNSTGAVIPFHYIVQPYWFDEDGISLELAKELSIESGIKVNSDLEKLYDLFDEPSEREIAREVYKENRCLEDIIKLVSRYTNGRRAILNLARTKGIRRRLGESVLTLHVVGSIEKQILLIQLLGSNQFRYEVQQEEKYRE